MTGPEEHDGVGDSGTDSVDHERETAVETEGVRDERGLEVSEPERDQTSGSGAERPTVGREPDPPAPTRANGPDAGNPDELTLFLRDLATSIGAVVLLGLYIFMISGVWPPMVAIESGSMEPNMSQNDLVFVMETDRFQPAAAHGDTGVVTAQQGAEIGYQKFGNSGDVIVYNPQGNEEVTPIIHRAMFWVEDGENWCDRADDDFYVDESQCNGAPHAGFITKGDHNPTYDQAGSGNLEPVKPEWIVGTAELRVPGLGWLRLQF